ncbi:MAG: phosphomannomutase [Rhodospirillaceae bacterium]|nr:phosphomannomutase [Rhodospirillaceae bacterium]|tara:strand:+ start:43 stop:1434 length:1392 start_codon:yes stop_codon:yes gene_type:complete
MTSYKFNPSILREYDVRGVYGESLTTEDAKMLGISFGTRVMESGGKIIVVGFDGRITSPELCNSLVKGLVSCGLNVFNVGLGPTPMLSFAIKHLNADAGVMVTGSHNPPEYNGFKMTLNGVPFYGKDIQGLGELALLGEFIEGTGSIKFIDISKDYIKRLVQDFQGIKIKSVAWDPGNGAACNILIDLVKLLPGEHHVINESVDGTFPGHHPDPTVASNLIQLQNYVIENKCEIGIAFDGDGDRIGTVDGKGRIIWADQLMMLFAEDILRDKPGSYVIADVKSSKALFDEITRLGGNAVMSSTGHSLVKSKMTELSAPLAGELSGHIFFGDYYYGFDDALYASLRLLALLNRREKTLSQLYELMPKMYNTPEIRFLCSEKRKFIVIEEVSKRLLMLGAELSEIDGVRVTTEDGWWLLRASNTENALTSRCESYSAEGLNRLKKQLCEQLSLSDILIPDDLINN